MKGIGSEKYRYFAVRFGIVTFFFYGDRFMEAKDNQSYCASWVAQ